jgi:membrane-bound lytic murein transglycosylase B
MSSAHFRTLAVTLLFLSVPACASPSPSRELRQSTPTLGPRDPDPMSPVLTAEKRMEEAGLDREFIAELNRRYIRGQKKWADSATKILEPNILGFLYSGDYFAHDTHPGRRAIQKYLRDHQLSFKEAEKDYHVNPYAIASLLWVETKLGKDLGRHPVPWVFHALVLGAHPNLCSRVLDALPAKFHAATRKKINTIEAAQEKTIERCAAKASWALEELKAIQKLWKEGILNPFRIQGSFAGAFGIPQFIPSSYLTHAVSKYRRRADLHLHSDAILSVGRFLSESGWTNQSEESQLRALYAYNRSKDYGLVISRIANALMTEGN